MPNYKYIARTQEGHPEEGYLEAQNDDELIGILQSKSLTIVSFKKVSAAKGEAVTRKRRMHGRTRLDDLITFSRELTALLRAGITLLRSLEIITLQVESWPLYHALETIKKDISAGSSLKAAIAKHPRIFPKLWVNIVETGETTGQLPFALEQMTDFLESQAALQRRIIGALVYPCVILVVASVAILIFIVKIIPMFYKIYTGFGADLPLFTQAVFGFCMGIKKYLLFFFALAAGLIVGIRYYARNYEGKKRLDSIKLQIFLVGDVIRQIAAVRFASGLSMLIKSGTPILHALDIVIETAGNTIVMEMLQRVKQNVREGKSMAEPILEAAIFPDMIGHMVSVGEESGELAGMLENAAKFYSERLQATVDRLATLFEPALIVVVGIIVGALVIAMFLPIFGLATAIKA